ncbi:cullin-9 isoform X2 [Hippocampus comes]|uniref:cullin-9 isoform X1 n=2 Tax=Hippocampus comes TaxID=109280 RepID=UPI00094E4AB1|nr:PREDICTED: cullin-9 isoform X1 [Hippocampus comes]XP_019715819.1 PREDICTED: cullin-9 isoform X2 [Hippocampus comes]
MAGERRNGNLLVQISPRLQAYPEELIRQRRTRDGQTEYLIRWCLADVDDGSASGVSNSGSGGGSGSRGPDGSSSGDMKAKNILMWMSTEDVYANCPALPGKRKADTQRAARPQEKPSGGGEAEGTFDEVELLDMEEDVKNLVRRARKQMAKKSELSLTITHTIHVLSAYAAIGSLAAVFKETGALDLLMELLCSKETQTRRSASKMLRALASHDAGNAMLSLSQQDGIEQHMDFDSRYTLLELFAETTSSEEHGISFQGVHLPQIPGKLLFSLVKRYLCVTSLMDKLNTVGADSASDRQEAGSSPGPASSSSGTARLRMTCEFELAMAMANLISELVRVMGWDRKQLWSATLPPGGGGGGDQEDAAAPALRSIFQPRLRALPAAPAVSRPAAAVPKAKTGNGYKTRCDFASRSAYVEYVQDHLKSGMVVRMLEDYEEVSAGDEGEFRYCNDGSPPVQVYWNALCRTYWVHWHMLEIVAGAGNNGPDAKDAADKASSLTRTIRLAAASQSTFPKPPGGLYSLPYLPERPRAAEDDAQAALTRAEWWELLFFVKKLEAGAQREMIRLLMHNLGQQEAEMGDSALVGLTVPADVVRKLIRYLKQHLPPSCLDELLCSCAFARHCARSGGGGHEREPPAGGDDDDDDASCSSSSSGMASFSKRAKKEPNTDLSCASADADADTESELPQEDCSLYPDGLEEMMKAFNGPRVLGKKTVLEKIGEVVDILKKGAMRWDPLQNLAGVIFISRLLEDNTTPDKNPGRSDAVQSMQDKVVKLLVDLLGSPCSNVATRTLRLTHSLLLRYEWRVSFATEGGVKAILMCMQEMADVPHVQQLALATLKVLMGAAKYEPQGAGSVPALSESGAQMMLEIFASIGSATPEGSKGPLAAIPAALDLMLRTPGCVPAVRNSLMVILTLVSNHKSLASQLMTCGVTAVLEKCLALSQNETMLAIIALNHIFMAQKLDNKDPPEQLDLKDTQLQKLLMSLKGRTATAKEVIHTLEQLLCQSTCQLEGLRSQVSQSQDMFQDLLHLMEPLQADRTVQLSILRILSKFLDSYQEDVLPWQDSIKPCLASMSAFISDKEVVQQLVSFLYRMTCVNKDYAVVMCRLGTKEVLIKAQDKHGAGLNTAAELRDVVADCDKYASLYNSMTTSVLAGCIQMVLGQIEEHRRSHEPINIPFFDVFLRNLCQGSSVELKEEKCWEKVEVSSNHHRASKLSDKNMKTYWESNGPTGSHFINIFMHRGVIIRQLAILVANEDSSYMPARILVLGGDDPGNISTELNTVNVMASASRVVLLENMNRFWSIIQIRIKRCQQGGIDTRVRGFEVEGPKNTFWPVFKEQLCCRTFLFYSTKAHSWCQEVTEDKTRLLQLFDKLNSALRHEQMFADRFLPDVEAAEALGRTCWEALVTPIVRTITSSEGCGSSPLSWLLCEYLDNLDLAHRRFKSRAAIFNSRVRRLTHLLVHVDSGPADPDHIGPPVKSQGKESKNKDGAATASLSVKPPAKKSSIADMAACWQVVVLQQVKSFLEGNCEHPDFVERYRTLYVRLKKATEELFGQQTAFVLALRHGFSAALLQLSILRAMHVSERFAQYVDQILQANGSVFGSPETLEEFQQFLEPMLFLSGLELANTFEHFYRYYMADRLLARTNVWLEAFVVEQLGSCFPNRFPQQMLKNLSESSDLRRDFHLYRLQQLDCALHGRQMDDEDEEELERETEQEADVRVLLLSPRCWTISSLCFMDEPSRHFPARLCSYLAQFALFYCHSQSMSVGSQGKPGGLQWTWLGHADVQFGGLTLHVSTLQMFILLQFNTQEEVGVDSVLKGCGLSKEVVLHALQPLIEDEGPLSCSHPQDPCQGVLQVKQHSAHNLTRRVELQPRQTYLNVDKDATAALETKRNFIYCLIVNILKQEKEMHIDNLVFKVLHSCHKREAGRSPASTPGPGGFSCSTGDVLSCIMHVMSKGCVRRNPEHPHMVEFLPDDPATPQKGHAHLSLATTNDTHGSSPTNPGVFLDGAAVDCALFSSGRSMTPEEVSQLMRTTVQQVAATLSVDPDRAEHLLVHCGWNADLLMRRYTDDPEGAAAAAGLECRDPRPPPGPDSACPVCLVPRGTAPDPPPSLSCMHYCCRSCWREYLSARIEQNLVTNCNCPIPDCRAQATPRFFLAIVTDKDTVAKYEKARLRGFVESCSNLTWCTNPQGCDQILCKENMGSMGTCSKCCWSSCFSCNFPEAHYPASCSHMSQWMDDGGFYEGMSAEAQSKHLAKLISKRCPSCQAQIEKNEGCLHMTCAKCNHGFCWRCLKAWKPTHKDYYNCAAMVSKVARHEKKFQDVNERCTFQHQAKDFAVSLEKKVSSINEALQMKSLTFVIDACKILAQARKVLAYSCVYAFYNQDGDKMDVMEQQTDALDVHTNALQILLEGTLLHCSDLASCIRLLKAEHLNTGLELMRRIQERLLAILQHSTQDFGMGYRSQSTQDAENTHAADAANRDNTAAKASEADSRDSDNNNRDDDEDDDDEYDDDYVPEWHDDYDDYDDEDVDEDDFFSDDDEPGFSLFD